MTCRLASKYIPATWYARLIGVTHYSAWQFTPVEYRDRVLWHEDAAGGGLVSSSEHVLVGATHLVAGLVETAVMDVEAYLGG